VGGRVGLMVEDAAGGIVDATAATTVGGTVSGIAAIVDVTGAAPVAGPSVVVRSKGVTAVTAEIRLVTLSVADAGVAG